MANTDLPLTETIKKNPKILFQLRQALEILYDESGKLAPGNETEAESLLEQIHSPEIGIPKNYTIKEIGIVIEKWYETLTQAPEFSETTMTNIPKYTASSTTPDIYTRSAQEEIRKQREEEKIRAEQKGKQQTEEFLKQQQERVKRLKDLKVVVVQKYENIQTVKLTNEEKQKLYALGSNAQNDPYTTEKTIEQVISKAVDSSPNKNVREGISKTAITNTATEFVENVKQYGNFESPEEIPSEMPAAINQRSIIETVTDPEDKKLKQIISDEEIRKIVAQDAQTFSAAIEANRSINTSLIEPIIGSESITKLFYGYPEVAAYELVTNDEEKERNDGVEIKLDDLHRGAEDIRNVWKKFFSGKEPATEVVETTSLFPKYAITTTPEIGAGISSSVAGSLVAGGAVTGFSLETFQSALSSQYLLPFPVAGYLGSGLGEVGMISFSTSTSNIIVFNSAFNFSLGNFSLVASTASTATRSLFGIQAAFGQNAIRLLAVQTGSNVTIGIGTATLGEAVGTVTTTAIATTGGTAVGASAGTLIGQITLPIPVLGAAIGATVGWLASKIPWGKIKKFFTNFKELFLFGGVASIVLIPAPLGLLVGIPSTIIGGASAVASGGLSVTGAITSVGQAAGAVFSATIGEIGIPILATLIGFPVVVALILFIINSGAYVVPPELSQLNSTNPYIDVQKTADPAGKVGSPTTITYTVTVTAKKDILTYISFQNKCQGIKKGGTNLDCKSLEQLPSPPQSISPGIPFSFTFTSAYDSKYQNALVSNTITVSAISNSGGDVSETGAASVCFGNCPLDCFDLSNSSWKDVPSLQSNLTAAASQLTSQYPNFAAKACAAGTINLCYTTSDPSPIGSGLCDGTIYARHGHTSSCDINFNQCGLHSESDALFILTHEATHHIQTISPHYESLFEEKVPRNEWPLCTYDATKGNAYESEAESDALYVNQRPSWSPSCISGYSSQYPKHYLFAKNVMFSP